MTALRVALLADPSEEGWTSMDLVADMLTAHLHGAANATIAATLIRPSLNSAARRMLGSGHVGLSIDRFLTRFSSYPRLLRDRTLQDRFDLFHIIDHTYAQLALSLPGRRTIVTCHDIDAFRVLVDGTPSRRSTVYRWMAERQLRGLHRAAHVACVSMSTRDDLIGNGLLSADRVSVIGNGVDGTFSSHPEPDADAALASMLPVDGDSWITLVHVGSTVARKRIDVLIRLLSYLQRHHLRVRLVRAGGELTDEQNALADELGVTAVIHQLPFVTRPILASLYRSATLVLQPSSHEGFGLPVAEALSCGALVVASDIPVLREIGGDAAVYCPVGDVSAWATAVLDLLELRTTAPMQFARRRSAAVQQGDRYSWADVAMKYAALYEMILVGAAASHASGAARI